MSVEVRNFKPLNGSSNLSINTPITFDLVAMDGDQIDINTLQIEILTNSNIVPGETNQIAYSIIPQGYSYGYDYAGYCGDVEDFYDALASAITYEGNCIFYTITLDSAQPFDLGQAVQVTVRVSNTNGIPMTAYISTFTTVRVDIISDFEHVFIHDAQHIPVYYEKMRKNSDLSPRIFNSFCGNFNFKPKPQVRYNEIIIDSEGTSFSSPFKIDYDSGLVVFDTPLDRNDAIDISYSFHFFSKEQINLFFDQAASIYRVSPLFGGPVSIYSADITTRNVIMLGAAAFAYRSLLASLAYQEKRLIFDNHSWEQGWMQIKDLFKSLWESYEKLWEIALKAKSARLPLIASVTTPEFSLPGGRTLAWFLLCETNFGKINFEDMFNIMSCGKTIKILTYNDWLMPIWMPISAIEFESRKDVYTICIGHGAGYNFKKEYITTSLDHKYLTPHGMRRIKNIELGEKIIVSDKNKNAREGILLDRGYYGNVPCYEIEIPKYHKFICENVVVSNSRLFRYLYKSGV